LIGGVVLVFVPVVAYPFAVGGIVAAVVAIEGSVTFGVVLVFGFGFGYPLGATAGIGDGKDLFFVLELVFVLVFVGPGVGGIVPGVDRPEGGVALGIVGVVVAVFAYPAVGGDGGGPDPCGGGFDFAVGVVFGGGFGGADEDAIGVDFPVLGYGGAAGIVVLVEGFGDRVAILVVTYHTVGRAGGGIEQGAGE